MINYKGQASTWRWLVHELGHLWGAGHSWENGYKKTGGIMDYGDGTFQGHFKFREPRVTEICSALTKVTHMSRSVPSYLSIDGVVMLDSFVFLILIILRFSLSSSPRPLLFFTADHEHAHEFTRAHYEVLLQLLRNHDEPLHANWRAGVSPSSVFLPSSFFLSCSLQFLLRVFMKRNVQLFRFSSFSLSNSLLFPSLLLTMLPTITSNEQSQSLDRRWEVSTVGRAGAEFKTLSNARSRS